MLTTSFQQLLALLVVHFVGDFVLQTHWQASNKSKRLDALIRHIGGYTAALWVGAWVIFPQPVKLVLAFVVVNSLAHFCQDYLTSRWSSRYFGDWHNFFQVIGFDQLLHFITFAATMAVIFGAR